MIKQSLLRSTKKDTNNSTETTNNPTNVPTSSLSTNPTVSTSSTISYTSNLTVSTSSTISSKTYCLSTKIVIIFFISSILFTLNIHVFLNSNALPKPKISLI